MSEHDIGIVLTLPVLRLGFGPLRIDPLEQLVGARVCDLLEPLMTGPMAQRRTETGAAVDVYPLRLPEGEGAALPLGRFGELGFFNARGLLVLTVPILSVPWIASGLGAALVSGPEPVPTSDAPAHVARLGLRLQPGSSVAMPLGSWGEIRLEAVG